MNKKPPDNGHELSTRSYARCFAVLQRISGQTDAAKSSVADTTRSRAVRELLLEMLAALERGTSGNWVLDRSDSGRPIVTAGPAGLALPQVSLSHCGDLIAAAVSWHGQPGIDVEYIRDRVQCERIAKFFHWDRVVPDETLWNTPEKFTRVWTLWEAGVKTSRHAFFACADQHFGDMVTATHVNENGPVARSWQVDNAWVAVDCSLTTHDQLEIVWWPDMTDRPTLAK